MARPFTPIQDRIRAKIQAPLVASLLVDRAFFEYPFDPDACWVWVGAYSKGKKGADRPVIQLAGRGTPVVHVARVMLVLRDGVPLEDRQGVQAAHICDYPPCVNPWHLEWQTGRVNQREGRQRVRTAVERLRALG